MRGVEEEHVCSICGKTIIVTPSGWEMEEHEKDCEEQQRRKEEEKERE